MTTTIKNNKGWIAGIFTAIAASLCCITPVLAFLGGASGLASSFSWIEPFRPYLIGLTVLVFAFAWYQKLKPQKQVDCDCEADNKKSFWQSKSFLAIVTVIAGLLIAFPYYAKIFYPKPQETKVIIVDKNNIATVQLNISGMDCEGCTAHINGELSKVNGVIEANTSYKNANAIVKFDNSKTSVDSLSSIVNNIGYKVISSSIINK
jgi:mercuric ion transport protein